MAWVQLFPTSATLVSNSVNQLQDNWLFLQNNIDTDHFFNTGAPTEGHHRYFVTQNRADPGALLLDAMLYSKVSGTGNELTLKNSQSVRSMVARFSGTDTFGAAGSYNIGPDFNGLEPCFGMFYIMATNNSGRGYGMYANLGGGNFTMDQQFVAGTITGIGKSGTFIQISVSAAVTVQWYFIRNNWV